jgi:hypothetical protein
MIYVDGTIASSELAGILVLVALLWSLWGSAWLVRVEVHALAAPVVNRLGLRWAREGFGRSVRAQGERDGEKIELRFSRGELPGTLQVCRRESGRWAALNPDEL